MNTGETRTASGILFTRYWTGKVLTTWQCLLDGATREQWQGAAEWYPQRAAGVVDALVAIRPEWSRACAAGVVAAFSPRCTWQQNVDRAVTYAETGDAPGLRDHVAAADRCVAVDHYDGALSGPKVRAFAAAIDGQPDAVVLDTWMMTACMSERQAPTRGQYRQVSGWIRRMAERHGCEPRTMQALLWILVRGSAE